MCEPLDIGSALADWPVPDWSQRWFADVAGDGAPVRDRCAEAGGLPAALNGHLEALRPGWAGPRFVPQTDLPDGMAYESFIRDAGRVPTREGLHDFFNALIWMRFPLTKRHLNRLQASEIASMGVRAVRGPVRDAITLFDENAVLLRAPDPLWSALLDRDWERLFVTHRTLWREARLVIFGHALLEKLVSPYKSITAHVLREPVPLNLGDDLAQWDAWLAESLTRERMGSKPFTPLPVMGIPGWCTDSEDAAYYADKEVFRPPRVAT